MDTDLLHKECVFIDTSIFVRENFLEGNNIKELLNLSKEGKIRIIMPIVTHKEILKKADEIYSEGYNAYLSFRNKGRVLRNVLNIDMAIEESSQRFIRQIEKSFDEANIQILDYDESSVSYVFESYFSGQPPFGNNRKKHEFPDAFALKFVSNWAIKNDCECYILTSDEDFSLVVSDNIIVMDYRQFLDGKLNEILQSNEARKKWYNNAKELFVKNHDEYKKEFYDYIARNVPNYSSEFDKYVDNLYITNFNVVFSDFTLSNCKGSKLKFESRASFSYCIKFKIRDDINNDYVHIFDSFNNESKEIRMQDFTIEFEYEEYSDVSELKIINLIDFNVRV